MPLRPLSFPCVGSFGGEQGVLHEHADGHGAYTARNRGDEAAFGCDSVEFDIAAEAEAAFARGIGDACRTDVNHSRSVGHHVGGHKAWTPECRYENIGLTCHGGKVGCGAVAYGDSSIGAFAFLHEHGGEWFADNIAAAYHHYALAGSGYAVACQKFYDTCRSGRMETWKTERLTADIYGMETVDIFLGIDGFDHGVFVDMLRQGQLYDETVDFRVFIEFVDGSQKFFLRKWCLGCAFETNE